MKKSLKGDSLSSVENQFEITSVKDPFLQPMNFDSRQKSDGSLSHNIKRQVSKLLRNKSMIPERAIFQEEQQDLISLENTKPRKIKVLIANDNSF